MKMPFWLFCVLLFMCSCLPPVIVSVANSHGKKEAAQLTIPENHIFVTISIFTWGVELQDEEGVRKTFLRDGVDLPPIFFIHDGVPIPIKTKNVIMLPPDEPI